MFHYVACGLPNVYLENGYTTHDGPHGKTFTVNKLEELHDAIGRVLVEKSELLDGDEVRFLRTELAMSRKALSAGLGYSPETVKKWESGENTIPKAADILLRALYREYHNEKSTIRTLVDAVNHLEKTAAKQRKLKFKETRGEWVRDCA